MKEKIIQCPYCAAAATLKDASVIYKKPGLGKVYVCNNYPGCDSYVGVHEDTDQPKGSLANGKLRDLRKKVHAVIDPFWRDGSFDRRDVYRVFSQIMNVRAFHVGELREEPAKAFIDDSEAISLKAKAILEGMRDESQTKIAGSNLVNALKYLYVTSQVRPKTILAYTSYKGHIETFKAAIDVQLVRRIQARETRKVFYVLTPQGESMLGFNKTVVAKC